MAPSYQLSSDAEVSMLICDDSAFGKKCRGFATAWSRTLYVCVLLSATFLFAAAGSAQNVTISANPASITSGSSSTLTVTAGDATQVTVSGTDGSGYTLTPTGGSQTVTPLATTTYTATATGTAGTATAATTVTVGASGGGCLPATAGAMICAPASGTNASSPVTITAGALAASGNLAALRAYIDNVSVATVDNPSSTSSFQMTQAVTVAAGSHFLVIVGYETSGGTVTASENFTVGSAPASGCVPATAGAMICAPASGTNASSPVTITAGALAASGNLAALRAYIDNVSVATVDNPSSTSSFQITQAVVVAAGNHSLVIVGYETSGGTVTASESFSVGESPSCAPASMGAAICSPANGATVTSPVLVVTGATTSTGYLAAIRVYVDGVAAALVDNPQATTSFAIDQGITMSVGTHSVVIVGYPSTGGSVMANETLTVTVPPPAAPSAGLIKHVVVIFNENVSFDHYFGTYPNAANLASDANMFTAAAGTPTNIANYLTSPSLLTANPNLNTTNGAGATNPFRLDTEQAGTADQDHDYEAEQTAFDAGAMDLFPMSVGATDGLTLTTETGAPSIADTKGLTMGYYDGNTVTALWNYAQYYAMSDHFFGTTFGPSALGALNLISGQTNGIATYTTGALAGLIADGQGGYTLIGTEDPAGDLCGAASASISMSGLNIGNLLNAAGVSWGMFSGGFNLGTTNTNGTTGCGRTTASISIPGNPMTADYIPHHEPFQYYASTANPTHIRPDSVAVIGTAADTGAGTANHQYDVTDFAAALVAGNLPAVSIIKAPAYQDGHAGYSDPLDEQTFVVNTINAIEQSADWSSTAIIIAYDDSDGWYDHLTDLVNGSATTADSLNGTGACISATAAAAALPGPNSNGAPVQGRCGHGPRLPLLVISPWANGNYIDNTPTDQASIIRFIEDTFLSSQRIGTGSFDATAGTLNNMFNFTNNVAPNPNVLILNPTTGEVVSAGSAAVH
jgi:phospholipase C